MNKKIIDSFKDADIILLVIELGLKNNRENKENQKLYFFTPEEMFIKDYQ